MFSYVINNPNNFVINKDYVVIPFGHRCSSALACNCAIIRKFSLPFDWTIPLFPNKIVKVLENNFEDFIPDVHNGVFHNKYDILLAHFNPNINDGIEEYKRRIDRFIYIIYSFLIQELMLFIMYFFVHLSNNLSEIIRFI